MSVPDLADLIILNMSKWVCLVRASDGVIVFANPRFERMLGYARGDPAGKPITIINYRGPNHDPDETARGIIGALSETGQASYEILNMRKDGTPFWCSASATRFDHPEYGRVFIAVHEDIEDRKRAELELLGLSSFEITYREDRSENRVVIGSLMLDHSEIQIEKRYIRKDGGVIWAHVDARMIFDPTHRPLYGVAAIQDITARKRNEKERQEGEERL